MAIKIPERWRDRGAACSVMVLALAVVVSGCGDVNVALERLSESRHLAADLHVQFTKAGDASNRAVMASAAADAAAFTAEAEQAKAVIVRDVGRLAVLLRDLDLPEEAKLLQTFDAQFGRYRELDARVLALAAESSNLQAQRLAFGPALSAADACRDALDAAANAAPASARWRARALAATAMAAIREIQALHGPHIADPDDAAMTAMETRMTTAQASARTAIDALAPLSGPAATAPVAAARAAFDRFLAVHQEIVVLSRRNTNVRSLILSLTDKRALVPECEATLNALRAALAKRGYPAGRTSALDADGPRRRLVV